MKTELAVALDYPNISGAEALIAELEGLPVIYKIGLELFLAAGPDWVRSKTRLGHRIFLDLKFYDIPNTVAAAVAQAADMGVEFTTVHLSGGRKMLDALVRSPKVLGVSVLTSFSEEEWEKSVGLVSDSPLSVEQSVMNYACFVDQHPKVLGMVCSPKEVALIRSEYTDLFLLVPGIRLAGSAPDDQARTMTPGQAARAGASVIVVGRPITQAQSPRAVVETILKEIST